MNQKIITYKNIAVEATRLQSKNKTIVLVGGCFDIIHPGHLTFLKKAKEQADVLLVALESDETVKRLKGKNRPINKQLARAKTLASIPFITMVLLLSPFNNDKNYFRLVKIIKPDIIAITKGDPFKNKKEEQAVLVGAKVAEVTERIEKYSTSKLLTK